MVRRLARAAALSLAACAVGQEPESSAPPLPEGWHAAWSSEYSRYYFWDEDAKVPQWELPASVELTPENWDELTEGKSLLVKFLAPW